MKTVWSRFQFVFSALGGWIGWFLGGIDGPVYALVGFVVVDYITGVMCAIAERRLSSEVGFKGICKKMLIFALVGLGNILDTEIIKSGSVLRTTVIFFYISNEGLSLLENASCLGLPIPKAIKNALEQLKEEK